MGSVTHLRTGVNLFLVIGINLFCIKDSRARRCTVLTLTFSLCDVHAGLTLSGRAKQTAEASVLQFGAEICF